MQFIEKNVQTIKAKLANGNKYGERVYCIAATKTQTVEDVNQAILAGVDGVAENKPQEFRDKNHLILPCPRHFIGHLQTNKIKYLLGKIQLYHSIDREELAKALDQRSQEKVIVSDVLLQINVGEEESKGGFAYESAQSVFAEVQQMKGLRVRGFMAMLPAKGEEEYLRGLARKMRTLFDWAKTQAKDIDYLSMGMSGDYLLCVEEGSNMIRIGSTIFGERTYVK
jgi:pyridoxal phosphate enzyme (YggS family)